MISVEVPLWLSWKVVKPVLFAMSRGENELLPLEFPSITIWFVCPPLYVVENLVPLFNTKVEINLENSRSPAKITAMRINIQIIFFMIFLKLKVDE